MTDRTIVCPSCGFKFTTREGEREKLIRILKQMKKPLCIRELIKKTGGSATSLIHAIRFFESQGIIEIEVMKTWPHRKLVRLKRLRKFRGVI